MPNRYLDALRTHIADMPDQLYCRQVGSGGSISITWGELGARCGGFQAAYAGHGLAQGDQVLIFLRHVPALYPAFFGAMLSGIVPAFMPCSSPRQDPTLYWSSHQTLLDHIQPAAIVTDQTTLDEMREAGLSLGGAAVILVEGIEPAPLVHHAVDEDAIGLLQHSSGTTGLKKGVKLSFRAILDQVEGYSARLGYTPADRISSWLPLYHDMGLIACMIIPACVGLTVTHIDPFWWVSRPWTLFDAIREDATTFTWLPNFAFDHLSGTIGRKAAQYDLSGMRAFISCSEPCKAETMARFARTFADSGVRDEQLQCCYAMAETVFAVTQTTIGRSATRISVSPETLRRGAIPRLATPGEPAVELLEVGPLIDGVALRVVDEQRQPLEGAVGEITLSGDILFSGYNKDPVKTASQIVDGWYFSRDLGFVRDGHVYVLGRADDLIIINGRNLYAHEIEAEIAKIDGLKPGRAVAIGAFDRHIGSAVLIVMAERRAEAGIDDGDLRRAIMNVVQSIFEVAPNVVEIVAEGVLIKTSSGKISRGKNLDRFMETAPRHKDRLAPIGVA